MIHENTNPVIAPISNPEIAVRVFPTATEKRGTEIVIAKSALFVIEKSNIQCTRRISPNRRNRKYPGIPGPSANP